MRRGQSLALFALLSLPLAFAPLAFAGDKPVVRRAEAKAELERLLRGAGNPQTALARLAYLGEQGYAARELLKAWPHLLDPEQRRSVAQVVAGLGQPMAEGYLVELTADADPVLRMHAASGLGRLRSKQVNALLPLLEDKSLGVRREAARALGASGVKKVGRRLVAAAKAEGEPEVRAALLIAAGQAGDAQAGKALATFLASSSESTRFAAAQGLCLLNAPAGFEFAKKLLGADDKFVRRQGVALFEGSKAKSARPYLEPLLKDSDRRVAAASARILYQGGDTSKLEWLVVASHLSSGDDKLAIERELETLMLTDDVRKAILKKAGVL